MTNTLSLTLLSLTLVALSGCVSGQSSCDTSADCPSGQRCDVDTCVLGEDIDCPNGTVGQRDHCAPVCENDADCGTFACDDGVCRGCDSDAQCGDGLCIGGECELQCSADTECADGMVCHRGTCGTPCTVDESVCDRRVSIEIQRVLSGESALPRFTRLGCQLSTERYADPLCDGTLPHAIPQAELCDSCLGSLGGCGMDQECIHGDCTCDANDDCPGGTVCAEGYCSLCATDAECGCDMYCSAGTCYDRCEADEDCDGTNVCAGGRCAGCQADTDCPAGQLCFEDGCVEPCDTATSTSPMLCRDSGRSTVCEEFEPIGELVVPACM